LITFRYEEKALARKRRGLIFYGTKEACFRKSYKKLNPTDAEGGCRAFSLLITPKRITASETSCNPHEIRTFEQTNEECRSISSALQGFFFGLLPKMDHEIILTFSYLSAARLLTC